MQTRILPATTTKKVQTILLDMNSQTDYNASEFSFHSNILAGLKTKNGSLVDTSAIIKPVKDIYEGRAEIELGKIRFAFNPKNGEILFSKKPWYLTWEKITKRVEKFTNELQNNINNDSVVDKRFIGLSGFTKKGFEKLQEASKNKI